MYGVQNAANIILAMSDILTSRADIVAEREKLKKSDMKMFMSGEINPYKVLLEQLNNERYDIIEQLVGELLKTEVKQTN